MVFTILLLHGVSTLMVVQDVNALMVQDVNALMLQVVNTLFVQGVNTSMAERHKHFNGAGC